eukprot:4011989-Alexandrium_andersonii.AAC.1
MSAMSLESQGFGVAKPRSGQSGVPVLLRGCLPPRPRVRVCVLPRLLCEFVCRPAAKGHPAEAARPVLAGLQGGEPNRPEARAAGP